MCNRFENERGAQELAEKIRSTLRLLDEALRWLPKPDQRPRDEVLAIYERDGQWVMGTALWGFDRFEPGKTKPMPVFNTRVELLNTNPYWRGVKACWLPATAWLECPAPKTWWRMALEDGEPFLLKGVCARPDGGALRCSMMMQPAAGPLTQLHDRAAMPYGLDAIGQVDPRSIIELIQMARM